MLNLIDVAAGYGQRAVLSGVNAEFRKGELTAVIGKNGCGKSTLLRTVARRIPLLDGRIELNGTDTARLHDKNFARSVSYLPQMRSIPDVSCGTLIAHGRFPYLGFPRVMREQDRAAVREAMERMNVLSFAETNVRHLSGGERQRVYLAMLLCQKTEVVLLDEPTAALDLHDSYEFLEKLNELKRDKTIVTVLHDLNSALRFSDRVYLLDNGGVAASGTPAQVFDSGKIDEVYRVNSTRTECGGETQYLFRIRR